jgi:hypothetical protein
MKFLAGVSCALLLIVADGPVVAGPAGALPAPDRTAGGQGDDPDELYRQREDLASARRAMEIWGASAATRYEAGWKLARAAYWLGGHAPEAERRPALERGVTAGETAARLEPDRPEGHYWLAADMGALAESFGMSQGMKYRSRIKSELERVIMIDPEWEQRSGITALGRWYYKVPRLFGGSRSKADEHFRRALDAFPNSMTALLFLGESLMDQKKTAEAHQMFQRVVNAPIEAQWAPEDRDFKKQAEGYLRSPVPRDKS